jgi:hypothetical protein
VKVRFDPAVEATLETYYQWVTLGHLFFVTFERSCHPYRATDLLLLTTADRRTASSSDIDLFLYGLDEEAAIQRIREIEAVIRRNQRLDKGAGLTLRTENAITFVSPRWPFRHVQVCIDPRTRKVTKTDSYRLFCACISQSVRF